MLRKTSVRIANVEALLCADLGLSPMLRQDHAAYIENWLTVLKSDKKAVFTAASQASRVADHV